MDSQSHTGLPNPEQQRWEVGPVLHLAVGISGDLVLLGNSNCTLPGTNSLIVTAPGEFSVQIPTDGEVILLFSYTAEWASDCTQK